VVDTVHLLINFFSKPFLILNFQQSQSYQSYFELNKRVLVSLVTFLNIINKVTMSGADNQMPGPSKRLRMEQDDMEPPSDNANNAKNNGNHLENYDYFTPALLVSYD